MPDLAQSLQNADFSHLRIVAEFWGIELTPADASAAREQLYKTILDPNLLTEIIDSLPPEPQRAIDVITAQKGRIPFMDFSRRFGEIRDMGPGKRDRERPHRKPASVAEILFYRALIARAFFDTPSGPQEFVYIPDDLFKIMDRRGKNTFSPTPAATWDGSEPLGRPASPAEKAYPLPDNNWLLDDATTLLAAIRMGQDSPIDLHIPISFIRELLTAAQILKDSTPQPEAVKTFLEANRQEALKHLSDAWLDSPEFNELRQIPGLICEGEWHNDPLVTRHFLLALLEVLPQEQWWSLAAFIRNIKAQHPDFQRPAGDYDSWFIKRESDNVYLRGFTNWDEVDGAVIRYLITGPMHWLGMVELAAPGEEKEVTAFKVTSKNLQGTQDNKFFVALSNGQVIVPRFAPRAARYQIARFGEWLEPKQDEFIYLLTPVSLTHALQQGLKVEHLMTLLSKHTGANIPPALVKALKRWETNGTEAKMQDVVVLRVSTPEVLEELRKSKAGRFLGEPLGPTTVIIKAGAQSKVMAALAEMGLLSMDQTTK